MALNMTIPKITPAIYDFIMPPVTKIRADDITVVRPISVSYFLRTIIRYITIISTMTAIIWISHPHWNRILNTTAKGINSSSIDTIKYKTQSQIENIRRLIALPYRIIFFSALLNHLIDTKIPHTIHVNPSNAYIFLPYFVSASIFAFFSSFVMMPISHCCSILLISSKLSTFFLATLILKLYSSWVMTSIASARSSFVFSSANPLQLLLSL